MKAECLLEKLKFVIAQIEKVSGKNLSLPILGSICIETTESGLVFKATNLNIGAEIHVPAKVIIQGSVAVQAVLLAQICNGLTGDIPVILEVENENLFIQTKNSKMTLKSLNTEDFPTLPKIDSEEVFEVPSEVIVTGIKAVSFAAATSDIKPEISSIFLYLEKDSLVFVATDAFRLAEKKIPVKGIQNFPEILIPVKNVPEIVRILSDYSGTIQVKVSENQISFSNKTIHVTSRLTGGSYPNYKQIMPQESKTEMIVLKSELQSVLKNITVFSDKFNQVDIEIDPTNKKSTFFSQNNETGKIVTQVESVLQGEKIETRINHRYIHDAMVSFSTDSLSFSFTEANRPIIMKGIGDNSFTYLVMSMNR